METNIEIVINSLTRQISELSVKLALAEAQVDSLQKKNSTEDED